MDQPSDDVVVVDFDDRSEADLAVARLRESGVHDRQISIGDRGDPRVLEDAELDPDLRATPAQTGVSVNAGAMAWGSFWWMVIGGVIGVVLALLLALIPLGGISLWQRMGLYAVIGLLGGSGAGFVFGGGQEPWAREGGRPGSGLSVAVRVDGAEQARRVKELLTSAGSTARDRRDADPTSHRTGQARRRAS